MDANAGPIVIRRIRADEGPLLKELRLRSIADAPEAFGQSVAEAQARSLVEWRRSVRQSSHGDNRTWLLAEHGGMVGGIVQGRRRRPDTVLLFSMWVAPELRRQGVGNRLVTELERWASGWDAAETILWVHAGNDDAMQFYRDLRFDVIRDGADSEAGARFGAIVMRRTITPP